MNDDYLQLRIKKAIEWLKVNENMLQKDIAKKMGMTNVSFSRGVERLAHKRDEKFVLSFHNATGEIFNLGFLLNGVGPLTVKQIPAPTQPQQPDKAIDNSSMVNAIIAAHDQAITALKGEVAAKEQIIQAKNEQIAELRTLLEEKDDYISQLKSHISDMRRIIDRKSSEYPFPIGVSDDPHSSKKSQK